jgi:hypothetical protein
MGLEDSLAFKLRYSVGLKNVQLLAKPYEMHMSIQVERHDDVQYRKCCCREFELGQRQMLACPTCTLESSNIGVGTMPSARLRAPW